MSELIVPNESLTPQIIQKLLGLQQPINEIINSPYFAGKNVVRYDAPTLFYNTEKGEGGYLYLLMDDDQINKESTTIGKATILTHQFEPRANHLPSIWIQVVEQKNLEDVEIKPNLLTAIGLRHKQLEIQGNILKFAQINLYVPEDEESDAYFITLGIATSYHFDPRIGTFDYAHPYLIPDFTGIGVLELPSEFIATRPLIDFLDISMRLNNTVAIGPWNNLGASYIDELYPPQFRQQR